MGGRLQNRSGKKKPKKVDPFPYIVFEVSDHPSRIDSQKKKFDSQKKKYFAQNSSKSQISPIFSEVLSGLILGWPKF
jgi:hypothetical protein